MKGSGEVWLSQMNYEGFWWSMSVSDVLWGVLVKYECLRCIMKGSGEVWVSQMNYEGFWWSMSVSDELWGVLVKYDCLRWIMKGSGEAWVSQMYYDGFWWSMSVSDVVLIVVWYFLVPSSFIRINLRPVLCLGCTSVNHWFHSLHSIT